MKKILCAILLLFSLSAFSIVKVGTGVSSLTAGRVHPLLYLSLDPGRYSLTFSSVGFNHRYGYFSGYNSAFLYNFGQKGFEAGLGAGVTYITAGYRDNVDGDLEERGTWSFGPAVKSFWHPTDYLFMGLQGTFGINWPTLFGLALQDNVSFIIGMEF